MNLLKEQRLIGFYESKIRSANTSLEPSRLVLSLAQALKARGVPQVFILCIDSDWQHGSPLQLHCLTNNSCAKIYEFTPETVVQVKDFILEDLRLYDFDDHFANPACDWRNLHIN